MNAVPRMTQANAQQGTLQRVVWHFGFMKTGTTAFQKMLRQNPKALPQGLMALPRGPKTLAMRQAVQAYWADRTGAARAKLAHTARQTVAAAQTAGADTLLISDENIAGFVPYAQAGTCVDMAATILPVLQQAAGISDQRFIAYTRDTDPWLRSCHNQMVKQQGYCEDFETFRASGPTRFDWDAAQTQLEQAVAAPVTLRDMGADAAQSQPLGTAILRHCGMTEAAIATLSEPKDKNPSLSPQALQFMLTANRAGLDPKQLKFLRKFVTSHPEAFTS